MVIITGCGNYGKVSLRVNGHDLEDFLRDLWNNIEWDEVRGYHYFK
jgi:hypothetical protein